MMLKKAYPFHLLQACFLAGFFLAGCQDVNNNNSKNNDSNYNEEAMPLPGGGTNLLLREEVTPEIFIAKLADKQIKVDPDKIRTCRCGAQLINIDDDSLIFDIEGHDAPRVRHTKASGDEIVMPIGHLVSAVSPNISIALDEQKYPLNDSSFAAVINNTKNAGIARDPDKSTRMVAVFDTGLDERLLDESLPWWGGGRNAGCVPEWPALQVLKGLNFVSDEDLSGRTIRRSRNYLQDVSENDEVPEYSRHGTLVTSLMIRQFYSTSQDHNLGLIVMRVLNKQKKGDSFALNCAMLNARKMGAEVFNLSLGYYGKEDGVFRAVIDGFEGDGLGLVPIIVTAAGNIRPPVNEKRDFALMPKDSLFYPAYFSKGRENMIAVTTARDISGNVMGSTGVGPVAGPGLPLNAEVCDTQNYGGEVVDVAVHTSDCLFPQVADVRGSSGGDEYYATLLGSSYAAPVISGWIAASWSRVENAQRMKSGILRVNVAEIIQKPGLSGKVRENRLFRYPVYEPN